jgi:hypothetical protein
MQRNIFKSTNQVCEVIRDESIEIIGKLNGN